MEDFHAQTTVRTVLRNAACCLVHTSSADDSCRTADCTVADPGISAGTGRSCGVGHDVAAAPAGAADADQRHAAARIAQSEPRGGTFSRTPIPTLLKGHFMVLE